MRVMEGDDVESDFFSQWLKDTLASNGAPDEIPALLFKFVSCDSKYFRWSALELVVHNRIRLSRRAEFNNPFDASIVLGASTADEAVKFFVDLHSAHGVAIPEDGSVERISSDPGDFIARTQAQMQSTLDNAGIYSMASSVSHPLMWAHYACAHRGIAFIFRHSADVNFGAMPVRYKESVSVVSIGERDLIPVSVLVKGDMWRYEKEWRLVEAGRGATWKDIQPSALHGVVFGALCSDEDVDFIRELIQRRAAAGHPPLHVYATKINPLKFELDFERLGVGCWESVALP